jgi:WD40 repeat protein
VHAVAFAPDGKTLLTGSHDRTARFWHAATGREIFALNLERAGGTVGLAFSPSGRMIVAQSARDGEALVWSTEDESAGE